MNAPSEHELPAANDATAKAREDGFAAPVASATDLILAWTRLLNLELKLAQHSLYRLLIGVIAIPVIGLSAWLGLSALLVAAVYMYTESWLPALLFGAAVQWLALAMLALQLRRWVRDLGLPQSRAALVRAMRRMT